MGVVAGERDPISREKPILETREEETVGGFDLYLIGDKSGSMTNITEGEALWKMQRRAVYLILSSLYNFGSRMNQSGIHGDTTLDVRTQMISFRGDGPDDIDLDKPLSAHFDGKDKVKMWHSVTNIGSSNGDVAALSYVYHQIKEEMEKTKSKDKKRLRIVIACSDGGYVGQGQDMRALAEELGRLGVIVVGMGLTETANSVPIVMHNPPHSYGDIVKNINDLPAKVAQHIIKQAIKLFPGKTRETAELVVEEALAKFKNIK